ncbi:MAG: LptA/OstA family protein [Bacillota bacterium]|nr:LptA/OstA family protein [Bacillota bacterium]
MRTQRAVLALAIALALTGVGLAAELRISVKENRAFKLEKDLVTIKGTIELVQGEVRLWAGEIVYDTKKKFAVLNGGARLAQEDLTLWGDRFSAWFDEEKYLLDTDVTLVKKDKDPEKGDKLVLTADRLEYEAKNRSLIATGNVSLREKQRTATARTVEYRDRESLLILTGEVVIQEEDDKTIRGETIRIDLDKNVVEVEGPVEANFRL